jgi:ABC-type transporter Mla subunit MlaD
MALQDLTPQLRTRLGRVERVVGLFVFLAVAAMIAGLAFYIRHQLVKRGYGLKRIPYYTYVSDSTGLQPGTPVKMMGFTVGTVTQVDRSPDLWWMVQNNLNVFVKFEVREPYFDYIWIDSKAKVGSGDFLGARVLEVTRGRGYELTVGNWRSKDPWVASDDWATDQYLKYNTLPLTYRPLSRQTNGFFLFAEESQPLPEKLADVAQKVDAALPNILGLTNQVQSVLTNVVSLTKEIERTMPQVRQTITEAERLLADARPLTQKPGGIGELLIPPALNAQLSNVLQDIHSNAETLGPLVTNISLAVSDMRSTLLVVQNTVSNLQSQLGANTNLVPAVTQVAEKTAQLAETTDILLRRHWLFRSAFKTNKNDVTPPRR